MSTLCRVRYPNGVIDVVNLSHGQLCELIGDARPPRAFWLRDASFTLSDGTNVKLVDMARLSRE